MSSRDDPQRKGVVVTFTLDKDSERLLRSMVLNRKGLGLFLSELIRREARERQQRPALIAALERQSRAMLALEVERAIGD